MNQEYWQVQESGKPLFPDIEWSKPEQQSARGKLLIIGGSKNGFMAVGKAFTTSNETGAGEAKVIMPDVIKSNLPKGFIEGVFLPTNQGGGFAIKGREELLGASKWADGILLIGDSGMSSETALLFEELLTEQNTGWLTITRDVADLVMEMGEKLVNMPNVHLVLTFAQAQKLFQKVYYPRPLLFSQQLSNVVESLHKFTTTYPIAITLMHQENLVVAHGGKVVTQKFDDAYKLIDGTLATKSAVYLLWSPKKPLESVATSWQM